MRREVGERSVRRRGLAVPVVVSLAVVAALAAWSAGATTKAAAIAVSPASGPPTQKVTVHGTGFGNGESVSILFDATQQTTGAADSSGAFAALFTVPKSAQPGRHTVTANGQTSGLHATDAFLVRTAWPRFHFSNGSTGYNPYENTLGPSNVSTLAEAWTSPLFGNEVESPAVAGGTLYVASRDQHLYAFSAAGTTGCSGTPKICQPLWSALPHGGYAIGSTPAVSGAFVYVGTDDHQLYAYSAAGTKGCSGTPKVCQPLWTASTGDIVTSSPVVASGVVYVGSYDHDLYAFSASGKTNCSGTPKVCQPLWVGQTKGEIRAAPAVANGYVYVNSGAGDGNLNVFSTGGCGGAVCAPLWTSPVGSPYSNSSPAVGPNGLVYVGSSYGYLYAYSARGTTNCSGTPKVCQVVWYAPLYGGAQDSPAVAGNVVYIGSDRSMLFAFQATANPSCTGSPPVCPPLWTSPDLGSSAYVRSSPAVANGVVYAGDDNHQVYAFPAAGNVGCGGVPKVCQPLWSATTGGYIDSSPAVVDGMLYIGSSDGKLHAYALP